jgi:hypothetical protein
LNRSDKFQIIYNSQCKQHSISDQQIFLAPLNDFLHPSEGSTSSPEISNDENFLEFGLIELHKFSLSLIKILKSGDFNLLQEILEFQYLHNFLLGNCN